MTAGLSDRDRAQALSLARSAIRELVLIRRPPEPTGELPQTVAGVFVSLHIGDRLRGCIGTTLPEVLGTTVQRMACAAATRDPRFSPLSVAELDHIAIEISVLTEPESIGGVADITIGVHGLTIERGDRRGLLLPQVASERSMTPEQFIAAVCSKARLDPAVVGQPGTVLSRFRAEVFGEQPAREPSEN